MQLNYLEVNGNLEEVTCHGTPAFPMEVYLDDLDLYPNRSIPWHWHKELELVYVLRGAIEFQTGVCSYVLSGGQGGLLPPNMLHMVTPYHHQRGSAYCAVLADPYLLHGLSGGLVEAQCASFITGADVDFFCWTIHVHGIRRHCPAFMTCICATADGLRGTCGVSRFCFSRPDLRCTKTWT